MLVIEVESSIDVGKVGRINLRSPTSDVGPNITGNSNAVGYAANGEFEASGIFSVMTRWTGSIQITSGNNGAVIKADASRANSTYSGSSLQPKAVISLVCVRY